MVVGMGRIRLDGGSIVPRKTVVSTREISWLFRLSAPVVFVVTLALAVSAITPGEDWLASQEIFRRFHAAVIFLVAAAAAACATAALRTRRHERGAWALMTIGVAMMATSDVYALLQGGTAGPPIVTGDLLPTSMWLASFVAYGAALIRFMETPWTLRSARARSFIDVLYSVLFAAIFAFATGAYTTFGAYPDRPITVTLVYFITMASGVGFLSYIATRRPRARSWHLLLLGSSVVVLAGGTFGFASLAVGTADLTLPDLPFVPWALAYVLVLAAGAARVFARKGTSREYVVFSEELSSTPGLIATVLLFLAIPVFVHQIESWSGDRVGYFAYATILTLACLVAVARNVFVVIENSHLRLRSTTDPLTGLSNHRHFHERLQEELVRSEREGLPLSVAIFDVDEFDHVNNVYGHRTGDRRLCAIAEKISATSRGFDIACRVGGDEFALVMPNADAMEAYRVCLRIQERLRVGDGVCDLPSSVSAGVAAFPEHARERDDLVRKADGALYWAKYHGRQQIVIYDPDLVRALSPEHRISLLEEESYLNMVQMLATAVDARDPYTQEHSSHVAVLAVAFAKTLDLEDEQCESIETAALLHDVGKIGVTDKVLRKPGPLTTEEMLHVQGHPALAVNILGSIPRQEILPWIAGHHERWDGGGYPDGLSGDDIPLQARILALCDAYDAMTTDRPYRKGLAPDVARSEILTSAGTQFDPQLAERFVAMLDAGDPLEADAV